MFNQRGLFHLQTYISTKVQIIACITAKKVYLISEFLQKKWNIDDEIIL